MWIARYQWRNMLSWVAFWVAHVMSPRDTNLLLFTSLRNSRLYARGDQNYGSINRNLRKPCSTILLHTVVLVKIISLHCPPCAFLCLLQNNQLSLIQLRIIRSFFSRHFSTASSLLFQAPPSSSLTSKPPQFD